MIKTILIFLLSILPTTIFAQEKLKSSDISEFAHTFEINNDIIVGAGIKILENKISESQFLLLGEQHYSPEISEFTNAILPKLKQSNFKYFAVEVGPNSTEKMITVIKEQNSLFDFNTNFYSNYKDIPFPFFDGKKDELFLKTAINENFKIWGIDQEFLTSHLFLIDEIYNNSNEKVLLKPHYDSTKQFIIQEFKKDNENKNYPMFTNLLESNIVKSFFEKCKNEKQNKIIEDLITSWKIYALNETKKYSENNFTRMKYMKRKFGENYKIALKTDSIPKVFVKMGSMHIARGQNWLGIYDLGNMIKELSYFNGTESTSINCFARFSQDNNGTINDYLDDEGGKAYQPILELAKKDKWVLIETKPILELVKKKKIELNSDLKILISGFDFILFTPIKTEVKINYAE
jgi:hypothetical protein